MSTDDRDTLIAEARAVRKSGKFAMRSCQQCNPAHAHLHDPLDGPLFVCNTCGHWFYRGVDLTVIEAESE